MVTELSNNGYINIIDTNSVTYNAKSSLGGYEVCGWNTVI